MLLKILAEEGDQFPQGNPSLSWGRRQTGSRTCSPSTRDQGQRGHWRQPLRPKGCRTCSDCDPVTGSASTRPRRRADPVRLGRKPVDSAIMEMLVFSVALPAPTPRPLPIGKVQASAARAAARQTGVNLGTVIGTALEVA